jgi:hypothetical protein
LVGEESGLSGGLGGMDGVAGGVVKFVGRIELLVTVAVGAKKKPVIFAPNKNPSAIIIKTINGRYLLFINYIYQEEFLNLSYL